MLTGKDLNAVQEQALVTYHLRQRMEEFEAKERDFETRIFLHRPELYEDYLEKKEEREQDGFDEIIWQSPDSIEEAEKILSVIAQAESQLEMEEEEEPGEEAVLDFSGNYFGIDLDELGGEDG